MIFTLSFLGESIKIYECWRENFLRSKGNNFLKDGLNFDNFEDSFWINNCKVVIVVLFKHLAKVLEIIILSKKESSCDSGLQYKKYLMLILCAKADKFASGEIRLSALNRWKSICVVHELHELSVISNYESAHPRRACQASFYSVRSRYSVRIIRIVVK